MLRRMPSRGFERATPELLPRLECVGTNGPGGYARNTGPRIPTRSYHGLLIARLPAPLCRLLLLSGVSELVRLEDGTVVGLGGAEYLGGRLELDGATHLLDFCLDSGL